MTQIMQYLFKNGTQSVDDIIGTIKSGRVELFDGHEMTKEEIFKIFGNIVAVTQKKKKDKISKFTIQGWSL